MLDIRKIPSWSGWSGTGPVVESPPRGCLNTGDVATANMIRHEHRVSLAPGPSALSASLDSSRPLMASRGPSGILPASHSCSRPSWLLPPRHGSSRSLSTAPPTVMAAPLRREGAGRGGQLSGPRACAVTPPPQGGPGRRRFRPLPRWRRPLSRRCHGEGRGPRVRPRWARHGRCGMGAPGERWRSWGEG